MSGGGPDAVAGGAAADALDVERAICRLRDLDDPGARGFTVGEGDWPLHGVVVRRGPDVHAYVNRCPHAGHPLNLRPHEFLTPDRTLLLCRSHGALFEAATGLCLAGPCTGARLTPVRVEIRAGWVLVAPDVDVAALADEGGR